MNPLPALLRGWRGAALAPLRLLAHPLFLAVSLSHFAVDVLNGQSSLLLAVLSGPLRLSNADIGLLALAYSIAGSLGQPLFGWLADRRPGLWGTGGVLWMAACFVLVGLLPGYWPLAALVLGALGSAAYHPTGTALAARIGEVHFGSHMATAASLFFLFGQGGLALGPALGGVLLDNWGRGGIAVLAVLAFPAGLFMARAGAADRRQAAGQPVAAGAGLRSALDPSWLGLVLLTAGWRVWSQNTWTVFTPKLFYDLGYPASYFGALVAVFMGGSALGGVAGALVSRRLGTRSTVLLSLALSAIPFYFFPDARGPVVFGLAALGGALSGAPHSLLVTMAQRAFPGRAALASGVILGFMFAVGTLGVFLGGLAADRFGLPLVLRSTAAVSLLGAVSAIFLPGASRLREARPRLAE